MNELKELEDNEVFFTGIVTGINLYQNKLITAHERKEPILIGDDLFYLQTGRERLTEMMNKILQ